MLLGVTLSNATGEEVTVDWATADGDAAAGDDYEADSGTLTFSGELTEQSVRVSIRGDESEEGEESFFVDLQAPDGAILVRPRGEVVILDDDAPPPPVLLEVQTQGAGLVDSEPPGSLYPPGTQVWLTAVAAPGHLFAGWDGDLAGAANPASVLLDRDYHVVARFEALEPTLEQVAGGAAENASSVSTAAPLAAGPGDLYLAAIAAKPDVAVTGVSGLGLAWSPVRAQCSGRGQTGIAIWQAHGEPTAGGVVTASFAQAPASSVLAVSRYSSVGGADPARAVAANSVGVDGACEGGSDGDAYALDLDALSSHSLVYVAAAARDRDHLPGPAFVERTQLFAGGAGSVAGVSVADAPVGAAGSVPVAGGFDADADWAVAALEITSAAPFDLRVEPSPGGHVQLDPPFGAYAAGATVELTAVPDADHRFTGWSGDLDGAENPATLLMDAEKTVGAGFVQQVRVDLLAPSGGSIALDPPGGLYDVGSTVTLTALPDPQHRFTGWGGALAGAQNPAALVVDAPATVAASFVRLFEIDVASGTGGSVALDPPVGPYEDGSSVTFTALADAHHRFGAWSGALAGLENPATLVIEADESVGASFVPQATLDLVPGLGGSVGLDPPGGRYDTGTRVTLTAVPAPRHRFAAWSGALSGMQNPASLVVTADATVGAGFVAQWKLGVIPAPGGQVLLDPPGGLYDAGTLVALTASPRDGQIFANWIGDLAGAASPASLVVDRDLEVGASFLAPPSLEELEQGSSANAPSVSTQAPLIAAEDDLYLAAIAFKPNVAVSGVSGLGLAWSPVRAQCAGRGQTGVALWQARGQPTDDGVVTASFSATAQAAVLAVSRYASAGVIDAARAASANSVGIAGACQGGSDQAAYAFGADAATPGGLLVVATAIRHREHLPGIGFEERAEIHEGSGGSVAGLALADRRAAAPGPIPVAGSFSGDVDWAAVALEIPSASPSAISSGRHRR